MSKHWYISHLVEKYTKKNKIGLDIGVGKNNWKELKHGQFIGVDIKKTSSCDIQLDSENNLPFTDNTFNVVMAINSLNYLRKSRHAMNEINRVLKKSGIIVCVADNEKSKDYPNVWEQKYLDRLFYVSGFKSILNPIERLFSFWYSHRSVYAFGVGKKIYHVNDVSETKKLKKHNTLKFAKAYNIKTTHPV